MEYQEVTKKDGKRIVFCNFEELLKESYGVSTMEEVETFKTSNDEYICHCPFCKAEGHTKHKLYVKGDLTVGHCFVCTRAFVNVDETLRIEPITLKSFKWPPKNFAPPQMLDPEWSLDRFRYEFDDYSEQGLRYLMGRHKYLGELWKILGFKFWNGNVAMPFWYHGELIYYQIRFIKNSKIRYFFPPVSDKPAWVCEHGDNKNIIICEGIYDAIALLIQAPSYTPFAVLGSSISDYQMLQLREYVPKKILIYMDDTEKSKGIAAKVRRTLDYCQIGIIKSDGTDPEENMVKRMKQGLNEYNWIK